MPTLAEMIEAARPGDSITLSPGVHDHDDVLRIRKDLEIKGPREAILKTEVAVTNGAQVVCNGFSVVHSKPGAPQKTGFVHPYPQNAHFVVLNAALWLDDIDMSCAETGHANKRAIEARHSNIYCRTLTKYSRINWFGSWEKVITLHANSFMEMFGKDDVSLTYGVAAGTAASAGAALEIVASKAVLSGCHWHREDPSINPQVTQYGAAVARDGFLQVGAGLYTTLNFPVPALLDQTAARKWVAPGCIG